MAPNYNRDTQAIVTPSEAVALLKEGNERFATSRPTERDWLADVDATASSQFPYAAVLGCIDSRVPVETVFDQGIGDLFVARIAGNVLNDDILGSLEFACKIAGAKTIVVLGHTACGAVGGCVDRTDLGSLTGLLKKIEPAIAMAEVEMPRDTPGFVDRVAEINVELVVEGIRGRSKVLADLEDAGTIAIAGALYDVATGRVRFL